MLSSQELLTRQNGDGGWSYRTGGSWTEPTCYALLALAADGLAGSDAVRRGAIWLGRLQRADGGWAPRQTVQESTWVTALVLLLAPEIVPSIDREKASAWLLSQSGRESGLVYRLRLRLLGVRTDNSQEFDGWPWYPGAAAWVGPTALSILAMQKLVHGNSGRPGDVRMRERIAQGQKFLLARRCRDGGWNHGSTKALGYDSDSYPETTGIALLALRGVNAPEVQEGVAVAERHLAACKSSEAASWLTLALLAQGRQPPSVEPAQQGGTMELSLAAITSAARQGRNLFLDGAS